MMAMLNLLPPQKTKKLWMKICSSDWSKRMMPLDVLDLQWKQNLRMMCQPVAPDDVSSSVNCIILSFLFLYFFLSGETSSGIYLKMGHRKNALFMWSFAWFMKKV